jgi:hypothetical protein
MLLDVRSGSIRQFAYFLDVGLAPTSDGEADMNWVSFVPGAAFRHDQIRA